MITASDSGIGKATAMRLARDGFDVGVTWHSDRDGAEDTAREIQGLGRRAVVTQLDVTSFGDAADTVEAVATELGGLDVFVNNAGGGDTHPFLKFTLQDWQRVLDLNLAGAFVCAQRAARLMVESETRGRIRQRGRPGRDRHADDRGPRLVDGGLMLTSAEFNREAAHS